MITPDTKVGALLDAYPGIEEKLIALVPAFAKLRNPILRKTVAKVATLEQAAKVGGIPLRDLMRHLSEATGEAPAGAAEERHTGDATWVDSVRVVEEIDADAMLETGVHPIGRVREAVAGLEDGEAVCLKSSFRPEPLLETMRRGGLRVHCEETAPGRHASYFARTSP